VTGPRFGIVYYYIRRLRPTLKRQSPLPPFRTAKLAIAYKSNEETFFLVIMYQFWSLELSRKILSKGTEGEPAFEGPGSCRKPSKQERAKSPG